MSIKEKGLIYPDGTEKSWQEVSLSASARELWQRPSRVRHSEEVPPPRSFSEWTDVMVERQKQREEVLGIPERVEVVIDTKHPILLWAVGDVHAGQESVDYEAFSRDVEIVKENDGYTMTFGDLTDSLFFGGGFEGLGNQSEEDLFMRAALGELSEDGHLLASWAGDHDCLDEKTEIYTRRGWLKWDEFGEEDDILTINPDNGLLEWHKYQHKIVEDFDGEMVRIKSRHMDILGTGNHRVFYQRRSDGEFGFVYLEDFANLKWLDSHVIPNASTFGLPDYPIDDDMLRIIAWLITDGWVKTRKKYGYKRACFTQRKEKVSLITDVLDSLGFEYTMRCRKRDRDEIDGMRVKSVKETCDINVSRKDSEKILKFIPDKHVLPEFVFDLSDRQFNVFLSSLIDGDGTQLARMPNSACFYQKDKAIIDDLQALCSMHSMKTSIYEYENRMGNKQYRLNICFSNGSRIGKKDTRKEYYKGKIWDVSIPPNRNFLVRRNGKCYFTGNSWVKQRMGKRGIYHEFRRQTGAHYLEGVSYVDLGLNNGEGEPVEYKIVGSHRHKGFSVYNDSHAALRQEKDEARGADISITAHNHVKGHNQQVVKTHGGGEQMIDHVALGTYKETDSHSRKHGWPRKGEVSRGGFGIVLDEQEKRRTIHWDLEDAAKHLRRLIRER